MSGDESDIRATLAGWYKSIDAHDLEAVGATLTETFLLIEHDELVGRSQLLEMMSRAPDHRLVASLSDFQISVSGDIAWSTHRNREVYTPFEGDPQQLDFLETVVLVRRNGRWLIDRYHATRLLPAT